MYRIYPVCVEDDCFAVRKDTDGTAWKEITLTPEGNILVHSRVVIVEESHTNVFFRYHVHPGLQSIENYMLVLAIAS